jgi:hypothetical protein
MNYVGQAVGWPWLELTLVRQITAQDHSVAIANAFSEINRN